MIELPKNYQPQEYEAAIYQKWEASGYFNPDNLKLKSGLFKKPKTFSIALPPPNATGVLHIGHASMLAYQDIMIRYHRLLGEKTLWLPGTDHAAIATQTVVEKKVKKEEGKSKEELGRPEFLKRVNQFVQDSQETIHKQVRAMGASLDWSREKFTLDPKMTVAVRTAFKKMYDDGLIYRGLRVVNWCPRCQSTLADDEVEYKETKAPFYYFKYGPVIIGTARPETKFSDKVIIVHPNDKRYKDLIGKEFEVEWINGPVKARVIADPVAEMDYGTGAMTITPAHSLADFELAQKYHLPIEEIIDTHGRLTGLAGEFAGQLASEARVSIVKKLAEKGLVDHIDENYVHNLSVCYRCGTPIEPLPSKQWFVNVNKKIPSRSKTLKQLVIDPVKNGEIKIIPDRFNKTYFQWVDNLKDWCVSRQIWYGHQIPVWYQDTNNKIQSTKKFQNTNPKSQKIDEEIYVGVEPPQGEGWVQDQDTLDTWFSSALWTFSILGWPNKTQDLKTFHPTSVLETMYDILFFWVARMIMMSEYLLNEKPFSTVYLHAKVKDKQGRKMSKSLGNGIDPIEVINKYGADAVRLSMIIGVMPGGDVSLYDEKIAGYRNFVNKLWNISRYIIANIQEPNSNFQKNSKFQFPKIQTLSDAWILSEFNKIIQSTTKNIEEFRFSQAGEELYEFTWSKLADWYLEIAKIEGVKNEILYYILRNLLILWHPFCPYITEVIWRELGESELLMVASWPVAIKIKDDLTDFSKLQEIISTIRNARSEQAISPKEIIECSIDSKNQKLIKEQQAIIEGLARVKLSNNVLGLKINLSWADICLQLSQSPSKSANKQKEIAELEKYVGLQKEKLANQEFVKKAPAKVIESERQKLKEAEEKLNKLRDK